MSACIGCSKKLEQLKDLSLWQKPEPTLSKEHRKAAKSRLKELKKELKATKKVQTVD